MSRVEQELIRVQMKFIACGQLQPLMTLALPSEKDLEPMKVKTPTHVGAKLPAPGEWWATADGRRAYVACEREDHGTLIGYCRGVPGGYEWHVSGKAKPANPDLDLVRLI